MKPAAIIEQLHRLNPKADLLDRDRYDTALIGVQNKDGVVVAVYSSQLLQYAISLYEVCSMDDAMDWIEFDLYPHFNKRHGPILDP